MPDKDGYPKKSELKKIKSWNANDYKNMMNFIKPLWEFADCGYWSEYETDNGKDYKISTGGWSGNEDLIEAMMSNKVFWFMCWYESKRGGHYVFKVKSK